MGIYNGTVSYSRFRIIHSTEKLTIARLTELIDPYKSPILKIDGSPKAEQIGWVRPLTPQDPDVVGEDAHWDASDCQVSGGLMFRVRYERRKVPNSILQMLYKQKLASHLKSTGKNMPKLERQKLKEEIASDLLRRTLPQILFTDVLWRDQEQELLVFASSKSMTEKVLQLFNNTFADDLELTMIGLNTTAAWIENDESEVRLERMTNTKPTVFAKSLA